MGISRRSQTDYSPPPTAPQCGWASSPLLRAWVEQRRVCGVGGGETAPCLAVGAPASHPWPPTLSSPGSQARVPAPLGLQLPESRSAGPGVLSLHDYVSQLLAASPRYYVHGYVYM